MSSSSLSCLISSALAFRPATAAVNPIPLGVYQHYKGKFYQLLGFTVHTETEERLAFYRSLYETPSNPAGIWVRPLDMFKGELEFEGNMVKRFTLVQEMEREKEESWKAVEASAANAENQ
jgi:hypothetical protein